jgi:DinB family protein
MLARDLVDRLAAMPRLLQSCAERLPRTEWTRRPSPGLFSLVEHCCHLRDLEEEGYTLRLRRMLREDRPELEDFDGGAVAAGRAYPAQDLGAARQAFAEARSRNLLVLAGLDAAALARTARFGEHGTITVVRLAELMVEHDAGHRSELEDLFRTLGGPPPI